MSLSRTGSDFGKSLILLIFLGILFLMLFYPLNLILPDIFHDFIPDFLKDVSILWYIQQPENLNTVMVLLVPAGLLVIFFIIRG